MTSCYSQRHKQNFFDSVAPFRRRRHNTVLYHVDNANNDHFSLGDDVEPPPALTVTPVDIDVDIDVDMNVDMDDDGVMRFLRKPKGRMVDPLASTRKTLVGDAGWA